MWLEALGREDLFSKELSHLRKSYQVCTIHFSEKTKFSNNRNRSILILGCVPDANLPSTFNFSEVLKRVYNYFIVASNAAASSGLQHLSTPSASGLGLECVAEALSPSLSGSPQAPERADGGCSSSTKSFVSSCDRKKGNSYKRNYIAYTQTF